MIDLKKGKIQVIVKFFKEIKNSEALKYIT